MEHLFSYYAGNMQ